MGIQCPKCRHDNPDDADFCSRCGAALKTDGVFSDTRTLAAAPAGLQKGTILAGRYRIIEELGRGGMGVVYKAEDTRLERNVALKFLPPELTHVPEIRERFMREARAAAALDHAHICTVYEFDESEERSFISMAYIDGQSLKERIESGPLELEDALRIAAQAAEGLQAAHRKGIVHRDIKSGNIMLDSRGRAKIMDFGLARMTGRTLLTQAGSTMGTVSYMSPEQARGDEVDHRTDIWSWGVVLYEMLTGRLPFKGEHEQAVLHSILAESPTAVTELNPDVPLSVQEVVHKALEKDPDNRYQQADELLDDLESITAGIVPEEIKARLRKARLLKRRRALLYGGSGGLFIAAMVMILTVFSGRAEAIDSIAVLPMENLTGDTEQEYFVDGVTDELIGHLGRISALRVISRTSAMRYKNTDKSLPEIARELKVDAIVEGTVYEAGDSVRLRFQLINVFPRERNLWGISYQRSKADLPVLFGEMAREIAARTRVEITVEETKRLAGARSVHPEAYEAYLKGHFHWNKFTKQDLELSRQYFELALEKDPDYALAYNGIAMYWAAMTYFGIPPRELMPQWKAAAEKCLELDSSLAESHHAMAGFAAWYEFDWDKAEREFRLALELNPNYVRARVFYGLFLSGMGRFEEAITQFEAGIESDPMSAMSQGWFGNVFLRAGRFDEAIAQYDKSLALQPDFTDSHNGLFHCYSRKGMYEQALAVRRKIFELKDFPDLLAVLDRGYEEGGYKQAMRRVAEAQAARSNRAYALEIATHFAYAEEKERALDWLEIAYQERMQNLVYLNVNPQWITLRDEPRFQELLRKMNLSTGR